MSRLHDATTLEQLLGAARRAARGKGSRGDVARFLMDAEHECLRLQDELRQPLDHARSYWPGAVRTFCIRDPKPRLITVVPFRDRVVHHALCAAFEHDLERYQIFHSYACRHHKGQLRALHQAQRFCQAAPWVLKCDVSAYFASIPHDRLLVLFERRVRDAEIVSRVARVVAGPAPGTPRASGMGLPIGSLTSQHLANLYLARLDHYLTDDLGFGAYLRYMDDFLVFGDRQQLRRLRDQITTFLSHELALRLNPRGTRLVPIADGVSFLGFRVFPHLIRVASDRWRRFRSRHESIEVALADGSLTEAEAGQSLQSQFAHIAAFDTYLARRHHLQALDERKGRSRTWPEPGPPWRLVEERPAERAGRQPQQERAVQPERQRRVSRGELKPGVCEEWRVPRTGPVGTISRSRSLRPGLDQTPALCLGVLRSSESAEAKSQTLGGGPRVAAGLLRGEELR